MKIHRGIERLLDQAQRERRGVVGTTDGQRKAFRRRRDTGELVCPYVNVYLRTSYWNALDRIERHDHVVRALAQLHPDWTFVGVSAASIHGLEHSYSLHMPFRIHIANTFPAEGNHHRRLSRVYMTTIPETTRIDGVSVTTIERTLIDCAEMLPFIDAMPLFNSALRKGVNLSGLMGMRRGIADDGFQLARLLEYATDECENGGEDTAYAVMMYLGFARPFIQFPFDNPDNPSAPLRVDFAWIRDDGGIIVVEFDGMEKYVIDDDARGGDARGGDARGGVARDGEGEIRDDAAVGGTGSAVIGVGAAGDADGASDSMGWRGRRKSIEERVLAERRREDVLRSQRAVAIERLSWSDLEDLGLVRRKLEAIGAPRAHRRHSGLWVPG